MSEFTEEDLERYYEEDNYDWDYKYCPVCGHKFKYIYDGGWEGRICPICGE